MWYLHKNTVIFISRNAFENVRHILAISIVLVALFAGASWWPSNDTCIYIYWLHMKPITFRHLLLIYTHTHTHIYIYIYIYTYTYTYTYTHSVLPSRQPPAVKVTFDWQRGASNCRPEYQSTRRNYSLDIDSSGYSSTFIFNAWKCSNGQHKVNNMSVAV